MHKRVTGAAAAQGASAQAVWSSPSKQLHSRGHFLGGRKHSAMGPCVWLPPSHSRMRRSTPRSGRVTARSHVCASMTARLQEGGGEAASCLRTCHRCSGAVIHPLLYAFYFEIIIDLQEVAKLVQRGLVHPSPSDSSHWLHLASL